MRRTLEKYGFAFLVLMALACASYLAGTAAAPEPVPDFALRAEEIYRLEIGMAFFVAFYLVTLTFLLALNGRGFAEFGTRGLKVEKIVERSEDGFRQQAEIDRQTRKTLNEFDAAMKDMQAELDSHRKHLESMEAKG